MLVGADVEIIQEILRGSETHGLIGTLQSEQIPKKNEIIMEVGGWVQV